MYVKNGIMGNRFTNCPVFRILQKCYQILLLFSNNSNEFLNSKILYCSEYHDKLFPNDQLNTKLLGS